MAKKPLVAGLLVVMLVSGAGGLDIPLDLGFQLGFTINVIPAPDDRSRDLGLIVAVHEVVSDKKSHLAVTGTITNFSDVAYDGIDMRFVVTSYVGPGRDRGRAVVEPSRLPPGATAAFTLRMSLNRELPRFAMYTVCAP